jgi:hypothetical protein
MRRHSLLNTLERSIMQSHCQMSLKLEQKEQHHEAECQRDT